GIAFGDDAAQHRHDHRFSPELLSEKRPEGAKATAAATAAAAAPSRRGQRRDRGSHGGVELGDRPPAQLGAVPRHEGAFSASSSTPLPVYPIIWPLMLIKMSIPSSKSFLDTGEVYYINWETGIRTTEDPRNSTIASSYSDEGEASDDEDSGSSYDASGETTGSSYDASGDTPGSSSLSSASSTETSASVDDVGSGGGGGGHVLVAAGCRACFTYFMVPKRAHVCPSCGGRLFHLGNNGPS
ncbi:unnamed protein product, partial [Musa acuminata var. zebrina]